jgi:flagellar motor switch protein FliN
VATLDKVAVEITLVLGTTPMPIHQVLRLGHDAIIELDAIEEDARERQPYRRQCRRIASAAT